MGSARAPQRQGEKEEHDAFLRALGKPLGELTIYDLDGIPESDLDALSTANLIKFLYKCEELREKAECEGRVFMPASSEEKAVLDAGLCLFDTF